MAGGECCISQGSQSTAVQSFILARWHSNHWLNPGWSEAWFLCEFTVGLVTLVITVQLNQQRTELRFDLMPHWFPNRDQMWHRNVKMLRSNNLDVILQEYCTLTNNITAFCDLLTSLLCEQKEEIELQISRVVTWCTCNLLSGTAAAHYSYLFCLDGQ